MGLFDDDDDLALLEEAEEETKDYPPYIANLDEGTVQAIFDMCLAKPDSKNEARAELFYTSLGYDKNDSIPISFDSDLLAKNKKNIMYLYGQLDSVHSGKYLTERQSVTDFNKIYNGNIWTKNKGILLEFLYLACNDKMVFILPFDKKYNDTTLIHHSIKPTISPKDPNFPAWWEEHKSEWEEPKKDGQEPADD